MNPRTMRLAVGVLVVVGIAALLALLALFGTLPTWWLPANHYTVLLPKAPGVAANMPVRRSGVRIGAVETVDLDDDIGQVRIGIAIEKKYTIRQDDLPVLTRTFPGDVSLDFVPKVLAPGEKPNREPVPPGSVLQGSIQTDILAALGRAADVLPTSQESLAEVKKAAENFNAMAPALGEAIREVRDLAKTARETMPDLQRTNQDIQVAVRNWGSAGERANILLATNEPKLNQAVDNLNTTLVRASQVFSDENQRNVNRTLKNVATASDNLDSLTKNTDEFLKEGQKTLKQLSQSLTEADKVVQNLQQVTKPLADRSESLTRNLDESSVKLNRALSDLSELLRVVGQNDGTLQRLLSDPALYNNLNEAACMVARLMPSVGRILQDFEVFADKLARHPEALGLGGAIRPSSGLK